MIRAERTDSTNKDFIELAKELDVELIEVDGDAHSFYSQFNKLDQIKHVVVVYEGENAVGCGAMKWLETTTYEVKRMFTRSESRGKGVASLILSELEKWIKEERGNYLVLETGVRQKAAIKLYEKIGFELIPNYGQYKGVEDSICFQKKIE